MKIYSLHLARAAVLPGRWVAGGDSMCSKYLENIFAAPRKSSGAAGPVGGGRRFDVQQISRKYIRCTSQEQRCCRAGGWRAAIRCAANISKIYSLHLARAAVLPGRWGREAIWRKRRSGLWCRPAFSLRFLRLLCRRVICRRSMVRQSPEWAATRTLNRLWRTDASYRSILFVAGRCRLTGGRPLQHRRRGMYIREERVR